VPSRHAARTWAAEPRDSTIVAPDGDATRQCRDIPSLEAAIEFDSSTRTRYAAASAFDCARDRRDAMQVRTSASTFRSPEAASPLGPTLSLGRGWRKVRLGSQTDLPICVMPSAGRWPMMWTRSLPSCGGSARTPAWRTPAHSPQVGANHTSESRPSHSSHVERIPVMRASTEAIRNGRFTSVVAFQFVGVERLLRVASGRSASKIFKFFLCRKSRHDHAGHFRVKPANAAGANDKIRRLENMRLDEIQHRAIDPRPFRFHQIEYEISTIRRYPSPSPQQARCMDMDSKRLSTNGATSPNIGR